MRGFRDRISVEEFEALIDARLEPLGHETIDLRESANRVLAHDVAAGEPVPGFDRAAMDGYAVRGEETFGADTYAPALFRLVGAVRPGRSCELGLRPGEAMEITTGSALPAGADAVVKVESTERRGTAVLVVEATPPGRHVGRRGEDFEQGAIALRAGRVLRPQDLGVLSTVAQTEIRVIRRPRVTIVVTGDELLPAGTPARGCLIPDANSVILEALIARDGGMPHVVGPIRDDPVSIREAIHGAACSADAVFVSGGSSTGPEDYAPGVVAELGTVVAHGVRLRPASPTGLGFIGAVPVLLVPGNPVSCLCAYDFFGGRIVRRLAGRPLRSMYARTDLPLARKLASMIGRVDYCRVRVEDGRVEPLAVSGAAVLSSTTRADGFVVVPADLEGYAEGAVVTVSLYDV